MLVKRKFVLITSLLILFAVNICMSAPQNPGSALIIYNSHRSFGMDQRQFDHSIPSMQIFRAALSGNPDYLQEYHNNLIVQGIPQINPPLTNVTILDIRHRQGGIDTDLRAWAYANLSGRERELFAELYEAGNPLSYWSQVYDLRYIQEFWNAPNQDFTNLSLITTNGARNDLDYFRAFMRDGGGLYIQAASAPYEARNESITQTIRALTRDTGFQRQWSDANILIGTPRQGQFTEQSDGFWFNNSAAADNFASDFNDLNASQSQFPMRWVRAGGIAPSRIADMNAIPLVRAGENGSSIISLWHRDGLQEDYRNGRLVVGFNIGAWREHTDGMGAGQTNQGAAITNRTTLALIQNLYSLMSETQRYAIFKNFVEEDRSVGETGTLRISVRNPNNYPFEFTGGITDDLASCLSYIPGSSRFAFVDFEGNATSATATEQHNGKRLHWIPNESIPARSDWIIEFQYRVDSFNAEFAANGVNPCDGLPTFDEWQATHVSWASVQIGERVAEGGSIYEVIQNMFAHGIRPPDNRGWMLVGECKSSDDDTIPSNITIVSNWAHSSTRSSNEARLRIVNSGETSISNPTKSASRYGIKFAQNIVSERAEISVILPNGERAVETRIVIYDMTGNVVFVGAIINRPPITQSSGICAIPQDALSLTAHIW